MKGTVLRIYIYIDGCALTNPIQKPEKGKKLKEEIIGSHQCVLSFHYI